MRKQAFLSWEKTYCKQSLSCLLQKNNIHCKVHILLYLCQSSRSSADESQGKISMLTIKEKLYSGCCQSQYLLIAITLSGEKKNAVCQIHFHINQYTAPQTYHIVRISIWKYARSICSMSTMRLYRQETAADHWGILWAIILESIVSCGRMFTMSHCQSQVCFTFPLFSISACDWTKTSIHWHNPPSIKYTGYHVDWASTDLTNMNSNIQHQADKLI